MNEQLQIENKWRNNRKKYNIYLALAGLLGYVSYSIVGNILIPTPYFEVTIFSMLFQGIGYLIMMGIANIFYTFLMNIDLYLSKGNIKSISHKIIFNGYFSLSCLLPFSISILLIIFYHNGYPQELMDQNH